MLAAAVLQIELMSRQAAVAQLPIPSATKWSLSKRDKKRLKQILALCAAIVALLWILYQLAQYTITMGAERQHATRGDGERRKTVQVHSIFQDKSPVGGISERKRIVGIAPPPSPGTRRPALAADGTGSGESGPAPLSNRDNQSSFLGATGTDAPQQAATGPNANNLNFFGYGNFPMPWITNGGGAGSVGNDSGGNSGGTGGSNAGSTGGPSGPSNSANGGNGGGNSGGTGGGANAGSTGGSGGPSNSANGGNGGSGNSGGNGSANSGSDGGSGGPGNSANGGNGGGNSGGNGGANSGSGGGSGGPGNSANGGNGGGNSGGNGGANSGSGGGSGGPGNSANGGNGGGNASGNGGDNGGSNGDNGGGGPSGNPLADSTPGPGDDGGGGNSGNGPGDGPDVFPNLDSPPPFGNGGPDGGDGGPSGIPLADSTPGPGDNGANILAPTVDVPEPDSIALFAGGFLVLLTTLRRQRGLSRNRPQTSWNESASIDPHEGCGLGARKVAGLAMRRMCLAAIMGAALLAIIAGPTLAETATVYGRTASIFSVNSGSFLPANTDLVCFSMNEANCWDGRIWHHLYPSGRRHYAVATTDRVACSVIVAPSNDCWTGSVWYRLPRGQVFGVIGGFFSDTPGAFITAPLRSPPVTYNAISLQSPLGEFASKR